MTAPSARSVLETLSKARLGELWRTFGISVPLNVTKELQIGALVAPSPLAFRELANVFIADDVGLGKTIEAGLIAPGAAAAPARGAHARGLPGVGEPAVARRDAEAVRPPLSRS